MNQEIGHYIRMDDTDAALLSKQIGKRFKSESVRPGDYPKYYIDAETTEWEPLVRAEQRYRKQFDPYQEWYSRIIEWAEALGSK